MKRPLIIVGAGAFARELLGWIDQTPDLNVEPIGFLDSNLDALKPYKVGLPVLGNENSYPPPQNAVFACGLTDPQVKMKVCQMLLGKGYKFVTVIHPTAVIGTQCRVGQGSVICPNVVITTNVQVGSFVTINMSVGIGHDAVISDGCTLNSGVQIGGKTTLQEGVIVGSMAAVLEKLEVGRFARIGAGSVVTSQVPAGWTMMGVPASRLSQEGSSAEG